MRPLTHRISPRGAALSGQNVASSGSQVRTAGLLRVHLEAGVCQIGGQLEVRGRLGARDRARLDAQRQVAGHEARQMFHVHRQVFAVPGQPRTIRFPAT